jgi:hypothetical protein
MYIDKKAIKHGFRNGKIREYEQIKKVTVCEKADIAIIWVLQQGIKVAIGDRP